MNDAWQQGYYAYENGLCQSENPWEAGEDHNEWNCGYWAACDDETSYQEFLTEEEANEQTNNL